MKRELVSYGELEHIKQFVLDICKKNGINQKLFAIKHVGMKYNTFNQKINGIQNMSRKQANQIIDCCNNYTKD